MRSTIMTQNKNLEGFKQRLEEVKGVKNKKLKSYRVHAIMNDMQAAYQIPEQGILRIEAFKVAYPDVWNLYKQVQDERWL